ncbi:MAG TPA: TrkA family potassium uptake protein [Anaerolineaceae bacterium]
MKVIVMGCGRMGEQVSHTLANAGHAVSVIDADPKMLEHLGPDFKGMKITGVGFDRQVLLDAGIETADAFVATSPLDNTNIISARIARNIFKVPRVVARLYDPRRAEIYHRLGLETISLIHWGAQRIVELLTHSDLDPILSFGKGEVILTAIEIPPYLEGHRVRELSVPGEISVITITRGEEAFMAIPALEFKPGDLVHLAVLASAISRLESLLGV